MRNFLDAEFLEDGKTIEPISLALVREDGEEYYACVIDADWDRIMQDEWLVKNVIPHLPPRTSSVWKTRDQIAKDVIAFVGPDPEFWGDFASYDWVLLCQLYGKMIDLPQGWPMFIRDIQQWRRKLFVESFVLPPTGPEHDALADARECKLKWEYLSAEEKRINDYTY